MGFITPRQPEFDLQEWRSRPILQRLRPLVVDWGESGFGSPWGVYFLYLFKILAYIIGAGAIILTTPGIGSLTDISTWWTEPIVYQKLVVFTIAFEILGLGCASGPLTFRFLPPFGGALYWLRPGTVRLPPWPGKVPLTNGTRRTAVDVALYIGILASAGWLLASSGSGYAGPGNDAGLFTPLQLIPLAVLLPLLGLRDKTVFLAARADQYWVPLLIFFFSFQNMAIGLQLVMVAIWWGAATSKLNRHFPFVVSVMLSNSPTHQSKWFKRKLFKDHPRDMRPSKLAGFAAHTGTVVEFTVPAVLLFSDGGLVTILALAVMVLFHLHIMSAFPLAVPLEWNIYVIISALFWFGHYPEVAIADLNSPLLGALLLVCLVGLPLVGNTKPHLVSFLPSMRYYAGNWATSMWAFRKGSEQKLNTHVTTSAPLQKTQLTRLYGDDLGELMMQKALAFRSMHHHGRALFGLLPRAVDDTQNYDIREGEFVAGAILGWNFGEGHLHSEQFIEALQERCQFAEGEVRVILLESQPIHRQRQHYRIVDAATGQIEEGYVAVRDMVARQPWLDDDDPTIPVTLISDSASAQATPRAPGRAKT